MMIHWDKIKIKELFNELSILNFLDFSKSAVCN